jgi:uncharacterized protein (DUF736 family)
VTAKRSPLYKKARLGERITTMDVVGIVPVVRNVSGLQRPSYRAWLAALDTAAAAAAQGRSRDDVDFFSVRDDVDFFSVRIELRLFAKKDHHADLDNYVKPILDSIAKHGVFGPTLHQGSGMTGDERVDHLELTRRRVAAQEDAGVLIEVWSLN